MKKDWETQFNVVCIANSPFSFVKVSKQSTLCFKSPRPVPNDKNSISKLGQAFSNPLTPFKQLQQFNNVHENSQQKVTNP